MKKIEIVTNDDGYECDDCGPTWAYGGTAYVDGEEVLDIVPEAYCYDGVSYNENELIILALKKAGVTVLVDGEPAFVSQYTDWYHGEMEGDKQ